MNRDEVKAALMEREKLTADEAEARISTFEMKKRGGGMAPAPAAPAPARPTPAVNGAAAARPLAPTPPQTAPASPAKAPLADSFTESAGGYTEGHQGAPSAKYYMDEGPYRPTTWEGRAARLWLDYGGQATIDSAKAGGRRAQSAARGAVQEGRVVGREAFGAGKTLLTALPVIYRSGATMGHQLSEQQGKEQRSSGPLLDPKGIAEAKSILLGEAPAEAVDLRRFPGSDYYDSPPAAKPSPAVVVGPPRPAPTPAPAAAPAAAEGLSAEAFDLVTEADAYLKQKYPQNDTNDWGSPEERVALSEYLQAEDAERRR
jgi:hypothetical protein